jgi:protein dithiol:quinone oxidoreductase
MIEKLTTRAGFAAGAVVCAALLAFAYYLQYAKGLDPCPLCYVQRWVFYALLGAFVVAAIHAPGRGGALAYGILGALLAGAGAAAAARQVWLQHLPPDKVPQCGPDIFFMMKNFPAGETLMKLIEGTGECAKVDWTFLGLSIAGWTLIWFVAFALYALWLGIRQMRSAPAAAAAASR